MACIQQKNEGEGTTAGRKMSVKLLFTSYNKERKKEEMLTEWVSFWNGGKPGSPQLYDRISEIPVGEWILVNLAAPVGTYDAAALDFIYGSGILVGAKDTGNEVTAIVGQAAINSSKKKVIDDRTVYEAVVPLGDGQDKIWYKLSYWAGKNPSLPDVVEKIVSRQVDTVFICGKLSQYEGKSNAFTATGFQAEKMSHSDTAAEARLPETNGISPSENEPESSDIQITIGVHAIDKPMLSTLTSPDDLGWMRTVIKYYTQPNEQEKAQIEAMKKVVSGQ